MRAPPVPAPARVLPRLPAFMCRFEERGLERGQPLRRSLARARQGLTGGQRLPQLEVVLDLGLGAGGADGDPRPVLEHVGEHVRPRHPLHTLLVVADPATFASPMRTGGRSRKPCMIWPMTA